MRFTPAMLAACACLMLAAVGCSGQQQQAVEFNNRLTGINQQIEQAQQPFYKALNEQHETAESKSESLSQAHDELVARFEEVEANADDITVPESETAQQFYDALQAYIDIAGGVIKDDYREMLDVIDNPELNAVEKEGKLQAIATRADGAREESLAKVEAAQLAFAKAHGLQLTSAKDE